MILTVMLNRSYWWPSSPNWPIVADRSHTPRKARPPPRTALITPS